MTTFENLDQLLDHYVGEDGTPYQLGRSLYNYTACGPWTSFLIELEPERTVRGKFLVCPYKEGRSYIRTEDPVEKQVIDFFCFDQVTDGVYVGDYSVEGFLSLLDDWVGKHGNIAEKDRLLFSYKIVSAEEGSDYTVKIDYAYTHKAKVGDFYYGDETSMARWTDPCLGIEIGSIVEGSDVEIEPQTLLFPFTSDDLEGVLESINDEAEFYWKRDNTTYFKLTHKGTGEAIYATWTQFDDGPGGNYEESQLPMVEAAFSHLMDNENNLPEIPGYPDWIVEEEEVPDMIY